ncbi:MAG: hypothetical protein AB1796_04545 [Bacillota bacterium]
MVIKGTGTWLPIGIVLPRRSKIYVQIAAPWTLEKVQRPGRETLTTLNTRLKIQMQQMLIEM